MATIEIKGEELCVRMHGWDKLLAFASEVSVPLKNISNVVVNPPDAHGGGDLTIVKIAGGYLPGVLQTGYFWVAKGFTGGTKEARRALDQADGALRKWKHGDDGPRERALAHVAEAMKEVQAVVDKEQVSDDDTGWAFYDVHDHPERTIGFDVDHQRVRRVVVEVEGETPEQAADRIRAALGSAPPYR